MVFDDAIFKGLCLFRQSRKTCGQFVSLAISFDVTKYLFTIS